MTATYDPTKSAGTSVWFGDQPRDLPVAAGWPAWTIGAPRLLAGVDGTHRLTRGGHLTHDDHLATHGPMPALGIEAVLAACDAVGLAGRGGAAFPLADKIRALRPGRPEVVVNGLESEPASGKDRTLLRYAPHLVLDGALALAAALGARSVTVAVHDPASARAAAAAAGERRDGRSVEVRTETSGRFVAGEARAVNRWLSGGPAIPPGIREHGTDRGLRGRPTLLANVETFAQLAVLLRLGPGRFRTTGTHEEPGTTLLTVTGAVHRPGVVEVPLGTPLGILLSAAGANDPRAVVIGGYHGSWLDPVSDIQLSRPGLRRAGAILGAGAISVLDGSTCALGELARIADWLGAQSAGQCGPCRFGLPALAADLVGLLRGESPAAVGRHAGMVDGRGACAHPDGAVRFVTSGLARLSDELAVHRAGGCGRPIRGLLPLPAAGWVA
jgi:NADH:ubiquinone oxidoreductase subunit F (NADH-binding)